MDNIPDFLKRDEDSILFNKDDATFVFYVPSNYFNNKVKIPIAVEYGEYISMLGICNWAIIDGNGKRGKLHTFVFPSIFLCKPREIEDVKNLQLDDIEASDYKLLKFKKGDQIIVQCKVPQNISNSEMFFKMFLITSKIPKSVSYDNIWKLFLESAKLNGFDYGMNIQLFFILIAAICRDPKDISRPFNATKMENMNDYKCISIQMVPKFISPYTAITSENWDDSLRAAIIMKDKENSPESPLEKVVTM